MEIMAMLLAEASNTTKDGNVNLLGAGITSWSSKKYPAKASIVCFLRLNFLSTEAGNHQVALDSINEDGKRIMPRINGTFTIPEGVPMYNFLNLIYKITFEFPAPGTYSLHAVIDNQKRADCPITAVLVPE